MHDDIDYVRFLEAIFACEECGGPGGGMIGLCLACLIEAESEEGSSGYPPFFMYAHKDEPADVLCAE